MKHIIVFLCLIAMSVVSGCGSKEDEAAKMPVEEQTRRLYAQLREVYISKGIPELKADAMLTALRIGLAAEVQKQHVPDALRSTLIYDYGVEPCVQGGREFQIFRKYLNARRVKGELDETQRDRLRAMTSDPPEVQRKVAECLLKMLEK